ncbi:MAG: VOC family protein [Flavobacteriales bacterium]|nr:VOC family protein [Flavobacteriales bacterium]
MLEFHHTGLLVSNIKESLPHYSDIFSLENISDIYTIESQKVKVCFIKNGLNSHLELVEPICEDSMVSGLLKKRIGYYHIGYLTNDVENTITKLEALNYKSMPIFESEAFEGRKCGFLFTPEGHLVEVIEKV